MERGDSGVDVYVKSRWWKKARNLDVKLSRRIYVLGEYLAQYEKCQKQRIIRHRECKVLYLDLMVEGASRGTGSKLSLTTSRTLSTLQKSVTSST